MTDAAPPPMNEPLRGRAALQVAALRGGVAALGALWVGTTARWLQEQPGELFAPGFAALAIAPVLLLCLWRLRMSRGELAAVLGFLVVVPLLGLALIDSPTIAFAVVVGVVVGGVMVGALGSLERVMLERASTLRARAASALLCGVIAFVGCGVVALQVGFTWGVLAGSSPQSGYAEVDATVSAVTSRHLIRPALLAGLMTVATFARLCHAGLGMQLLSVTCLTPLVAVVPILLQPGVRLDELLSGWAVGWPFLLVLRGLDAVETSVLHTQRPVPLPFRAGTRRRVVVAVIGAILVMSMIHGGLTLLALRRRTAALHDLARRGEPTRLEDLDVPAAEQDAFVLYRAAAAAYKAPRKRPRAKSTDVDAATVAALQSAQAPNDAVLSLFVEGARRPRCGFVPEFTTHFVIVAARELLEDRFRLHLLKDEVDGAVEVIRLRRALFAGADPAYGSRAILRGLAQAQQWTLELTASTEMADEHCRQLLGVLEPPLDDRFLQRAVQELRLDLVGARDAPVDDFGTPLAGRLPWVRDLDLVDALERVDVFAAAAREGGVAGLQRSINAAEEPGPWPRLRPFAHESAVQLVSSLNDVELRRRLCVIALSLRLHRLANGAYPATLDPLVPGQLAEVPRDLTGVPFVYALNGTGVTLATPGKPRLVVRVR